MFSFLEKLNQAVWGAPLLCTICVVGIVCSVTTRFAQFRLFPEAVKSFLSQFKRKSASSDISPFRALCMALAATVGTGNLAGVAGAISIGGPGAIFWMWILGILGMVIKFTEVILAIRYRTRNANGEYVGGPMYMMKAGLNKNWSWMAVVYCLFGIIASLGVGNATQINTVIDGIEGVALTFERTLSVAGRVLVGAVLSVFVWLLLKGGMKRIGRATEVLIPFVTAAYLILTIIVLVIRKDALPGAFQNILYGAFSPKAVTGGIIGSALTTLRIGAARGVFTNEAGMGTASIAHASAEVRDPIEQGLMGIIEVFLDTIVICTMTALVILCSHVDIPYGTDAGILLTTEAFASVCGDWVNIFVSVALSCFAFATILGWSLYGARCAQFLFGERAWSAFVLLQVFAAMCGALLQTGTVWLLSDIVNGLMALPNLITLLLLCPEIVKLTRNDKLSKQKHRA